MKIILNSCLLYLSTAIVSTAFSQTDDEYKNFSNQAKKTFKLSQEEADKFTDSLKNARKGFEETFNGVEKLVDDEKILKSIRKSFPDISREGLKKTAKDLEDDKLDKIVQIAKDSKDQFKDWVNKLKEALPNEKATKFGKKLADQLGKCITSKKLPLPKKKAPKTDDEKIKNTIEDMGIEDNDTKDKVKGLLEKTWKLHSERKKIESNLKKVLGKKKISDSESDKVKELVKKLRDNKKEIDEHEEELQKTINMKQYIVYLRNLNVKSSSGFPFPGNR